MSDAHQPTLEYSGATVKPGVPAGIMIAEICGLSADLPVMARAVTTEVIDVPEFVMNDFDPSTTHSSPSSRAMVRMPPGMSDPPPGSVSPKAASRSPWHRSGSHRSRCAPLPNRKIGIAPSATAASSVMATDESTRASSCRARQRAKKSPPIPPYSSGKGSPKRPSLPILAMIS